MTPTEIITQDAQAHGKDPKILLQWISALIHTHDGVLLQHGDSVLLLKKIAPHQISTHLFTQDKPIALMGALKYFYDEIKKSDIHVMYGQADNPQIMRMLKMAGIPIVDSDKRQFNWMADVKE